MNAAEIAALEQAIDEEYLALNTYQAVLTQLGSISPFSRIAPSEQQHVTALGALFTKYNLATPANPGLSPAPVFANRRAACQVGVDVEIADAALYDVLLPVEDGKVASHETREKLAHGHGIVPEAHGHHGVEHGMGPAEHDRHMLMSQSITDCEAVICRGMGQGAYVSMTARGIRPVVTDIADIDGAVAAYVAGDIVDHTERLH